MDLLGLRNLTIIDDCLKEIKRLYNVSIDLTKIDLSDPKLYRLLSDGRTSGVFQLESEGMRKTLKTVKPDCFIDVCNVLALYRPGPRDFIEEFTKRKNHQVEVTYPDESLKEIAKKAIERKTGARGLRSIMENTLMDLMYELPNMKDLKEVIIDKETIVNKEKPTFVFKSDKIYLT